MLRRLRRERQRIRVGDEIDQRGAAVTERVDEA
jgi:hypothetical protein